MVSFKDIDADVILLDFWGSWCRQCRKSIDHHRELQEKFGAKRVQVIGIACEKGATLEDRRGRGGQPPASSASITPCSSRRMDGNCPVQKALQVQFYPTMVVLDREGKILQFERGATDATLGRTRAPSLTPSRIGSPRE